MSTLSRWGGGDDGAGGVLGGNGASDGFGGSGSSGGEGAGEPSMQPERHVCSDEPLSFGQKVIVLQSPPQNFRLGWS